MATHSKQNLNTENLEQGNYCLTGTILRRKSSIKSTQHLLIFFKELGPRWVSAPINRSRTGITGVEPLVWGSFNLYQSPTSLSVKSFDVKEDFLKIRMTPKKLLCAVKLYKLTGDKLFLGHENDDALKLLWNTMNQISEVENLDLVEFRFIWRLLNIMGRAPSFKYCVNCGSKIEAIPAKWSEDGLICDKCSGITDLCQEEIKKLQYIISLNQENFIKWADMVERDEKVVSISKKMLTFFDIA